MKELVSLFYNLHLKNLLDNLIYKEEFNQCDIINNFFYKILAKSPVFSHVSSSLLGLTTIRSACAQNMVRKEFDVHQDLHTSAYYLTITTSTAFGFALDIVSICFIAFITYSFIVLDNGNFFFNLYIIKKNSIM